MDVKYISENDSSSESTGSVVLSQGHASFSFHDLVCEILEKDSKSRSDVDLHVLLEFTQHFPAFSNLTTATKMELCREMVYVAIEEAGTIVLTDREELDSWSVIINGGVNVESAAGTTYSMTVGDFFGVTPIPGTQFQAGTMLTTRPNTQFLCIVDSKYRQILKDSHDTMLSTKSNGKLLCVFEKKGTVSTVIRARAQWLVNNLISDYHDDEYILDFLLTFRVFIPDPMLLPNQMMTWVSRTELRDKVVDLFVVWVTNHFTYFLNNIKIWKFFHGFCNRILELGFSEKLQDLALECSKNTTRRTITVEDSANFHFIYFVSPYGVYIKQSFANELKRGDKV